MYVAYLRRNTQGFIVQTELQYWLEDDSPAGTLIACGFIRVEYEDASGTHTFYPTRATREEIDK